MTYWFVKRRLFSGYLISGIITYWIVRWFMIGDFKGFERKLVKKDITATGRGGPQGCETTKPPHCLDNRLIDGYEFVSLTRHVIRVTSHEGLHVSEVSKLATLSTKSAHRWRWVCQPYEPVGFYSPLRFLVHIFVRGWVDPRDHSASWKD
jgi:hypothetical protein